MIEIRRILCPVDFSEFSRRALHHAAAIARWYGSTVTALYVYPAGVPPAAMAMGMPPEAAAAMVLTPAGRDRLHGELEGLVGAEQATGVPIELVVTEGDVAREIAAHAETMPADLMVLGTHGRSGFERLVLGSITEKVLRRAACPVLTVPRQAPEASAPPALFERILVAIDFSDASLLALEHALSLAREADARLTLLHVVEVSQRLDGWMGETAAMKAYVRELEEDARGRLSQLVPDDARSYCRVEERIATGQPYREILRAAAEQRDGLIVMGAYGHGVIDRMFVGSTAQHVVRQATCPVLTLRGPA